MTQNTDPAPPVDNTASGNQSEPTGPTTSPDVVITNDPGPPPEGDAPTDDGSVVDQQKHDPLSDDPVENA